MKNKTVKISNEDYYKLEELRLFLLKKGSGSVTKKELIGLLLSSYRPIINMKK